MKGSLWAVWRWVKWPFFVLSFAYAVLVGWRVFGLFEEEKTQAVVTEIHAAKIILADVMGENLPPIPNQEENDATVAGIDKNANGVRDDVEHAIFAKYPNSAKVRAAELQYAMAMQLMLTRVFNTETWIAAAEESSRGAACIGESIPNKNITLFLGRNEEVEGFVINTESRRIANDRAYDFTTSYGLPSTDICNIDLEKLPN